MNTNWFSSRFSLRAKRRAAYELDDAILRGELRGTSGNLDAVVQDAVAQDTVARAILELRAAQARINADPSVTEPPATLVREFRAALAPVASSAPASSSIQVAKRPSPLRPVVALAAAVVILGGGGVALAANGSLPAPIQSGLADVVGVVGISIPDASNSPSNEVADPAQNDSVNRNPNRAGSRPKELDRASEAEVVAMQNWCSSRDKKLAAKKKLGAVTKACRDLSEISSDSPEAVVALATFKTKYEQVKSLFPQAWKNELMAISGPARPRRQTDTDSGRQTDTDPGRTTATTQPRTTATTQPRTTVPSTAPRISDDQRRAAERAAEDARRAAEDARRAAENARRDAERDAENARRDAERDAERARRDSENSETKTPAEPSVRTEDATN